MQQAVETIFKGFVAGHAELFEPLIAQSPLNDLPTAEELAEMFLALIEGAIVIAKSYREIEPLARSIKGFKRYLVALSGMETPVTSHPPEIREPAPRDTQLVPPSTE